jgi:hypothetical protein
MEAATGDTAMDRGHAFPERSQTEEGKAGISVHSSSAATDEHIRGSPSGMVALDARERLRLPAAPATFGCSWCPSWIESQIERGTRVG